MPDSGLFLTFSGFSLCEFSFSQKSVILHFHDVDGSERSFCLCGVTVTVRKLHVPHEYEQFSAANYVKVFLKMVVLHKLLNIIDSAPEADYDIPLLKQNALNIKYSCENVSLGNSYFLNL